MIFGERDHPLDSPTAELDRRHLTAERAQCAMPYATQTGLPRVPECARIARRFVEEHMPAELDPDSLYALKLVTSELVTNAYIHGQGQIRLRLNRYADRVHVEVIDQGHDAAVKIREQGPGLGGSGLKIVDRLAYAWGAHEGTTHVWAELPLDA
jgi:anti-sigma regulatory factor (Ser/Thr protein kinase)